MLFLFFLLLLLLLLQSFLVRNAFFIRVDSFTAVSVHCTSFSWPGVQTSHVMCLLPTVKIERTAECIVYQREAVQESRVSFDMLRTDKTNTNNTNIFFSVSSFKSLFFLFFLSLISFSMNMLFFLLSSFQLLFSCHGNVSLLDLLLPFFLSFFN